MKALRRVLTSILAVSLLCSGSLAQKFLPDDPIMRDPDDSSIERPARVELGPTWDAVMNTFGDEAQGPLLRAQNINTLGEVPDSSWFTNRIGVRDLSIEELTRGNDLTGGPDLDGDLTVVGAALISISEGIIVRDGKNDYYYLIFDPKDHPELVTGSSVIANRFFHAAGYKVLPNYIIEIDPARIRLDPNAQVVKLGGVRVPLNDDYVRLALEDAAPQADGKYGALAIHMIAGLGERVEDTPYLGEFQFHGQRSDDPNDLYLHENRRELRALGLFAAWLNFTFCNALATRDIWVSKEGKSFLEHYLVDFTGALGVGRDFEGRPVPKDARSGHENEIPGNVGWSLKTAITLGFWYRPWMKIDFPTEPYPELGLLEGEYFQPDAWIPEYPNAAFTRMLPDDAYWAARIISRFSDQAIEAIVREGRYSDPAAERTLVDILKTRRDKVVDYAFLQANPLDEFRIDEGTLDFRNLGEERGLATISTYEYEWFELDNSTGQLTSLSDRRLSALTRLEIPRETSDYLMVRLRTRSAETRSWRKNVDVYLRMDSDPDIVGIEREVGVFILERSLEGREVVRSSIELAGTYEGLEPEQRRLVDDWIRRVNAATSRNLGAEQAYTDLPMSVRTTYEGATHALMESRLTDEKGNSLGTALDLVDQLERVNGKIKGAGGDQQFRIYVKLVPDAIEILERSNEFARGADNTVYHKGFPMNYRQQGGVPSIQISIALNEERADIDVDYRASSFPGALVNGHLTSANSDVRAGNNHQRHINRWQGFTDWWRGLFGLPQMREMFGVDEPEKLLIPRFPRKGDKSVEEAAEDFLEAWLIDNEPGEAVAYLAERAYFCTPEAEEGTPPDFGIAPLVALERLAAARAPLGNPKSLSQVLTPFSLKNPRLRLVEPKKPAPFVLYDVPEDLALSFDCAGRNQFEPAREGRQDKYGSHFGSVFKVTGPEGESSVIALLWEKVEGHWRVVSYEVEPEGGDVPGPGLVAPVAPTIQRVTASPEFLAANKAFLRAWGQGRIDEVVAFIDRSCLDCFNLYRREDQEPVTQWDDAMQQWKEGFRRVYEGLRQADNILDVIEAVEVVHPDIRVVEHEDQNAITLMSLPDHLAEQYDCSKIVNGTVNYRSPAEKQYGNYYATAIRFKLSGEEPAVLYLLWSQVEGSWKITWYSIVRP